MNSLAKDRATEYVRLHPERMTREQLNEFSDLADRVYLEAFRHGLRDALPRVPELSPELESNDPQLPPVQYQSKLNLPGDFDLVRPLDESTRMDVAGCPPNLGLSAGAKVEKSRAYLVCAPPRWRHNLDVLRTLAGVTVEPSKVDPYVHGETPSECAKRMGTIKRWIADGKLRCEKVTARLWRLDREDVRKLGGRLDDQGPPKATWVYRIGTHLKSLNWDKG